MGDNADCSPTGPKTKLSNGKTVINLASYNFLNFGNLDRLRNRAVDTLHDYGVGACGPPGFYGTLGPFPSSLCSQSCADN